MSQQVALICTTERIDGYADKVAGELYAVNISTALMAPLPKDLAGIEDMLRPWQWKPLKDGGPFEVTVFLQSDPKDIAQGSLVAGTCVAPPPLSAAAQQALTDSLTAQLEAAFKSDPDLIAFDNANPGHLESSPDPTIQPWPHLLAHASTFPAPVPQSLNLVLFFRIPALDAKVVKVYAAPNFLANNVTCDATKSQPAAPTVAGTGAISPVSTWAYKIDAKLPQVTVFQPGFDPTVAALPIWISGTPAVTAEDGANQDWRTNFDQTLPDTFDLGQRSIDALRALTPDQIASIFNLAPDEPQPSDDDRVILEDLRVAILSVLRDTADFGLRYAPDGVNLLQFVLRGAKQTDAQIEPILDALVLADAKIDFFTWQANLQTLFSGLLLLSPITNKPASNDGKTAAVPSLWPDNQANLNTLIAQLDALQTKLADDATLAKWLYLNWDAVLKSSKPDPWNAMSSAVLAQLSSLSTSHALRKRMLQANIGGPYVNSLVPDISIWKQITAINPGKATDTDQLKFGLTMLLPAFFASRFNQAPPPGVTIANSARQPGISGTQTGFAKWQELLTAMNGSITKQAADFAENLFPGDPKPTTVPQALIVKVQETGQVADQENPLRTISGIGVLLRENGSNDWSALNIASLFVNSSQTLEPGKTPTYVLAASNILAPYRISERNGILQTAISYDNNPLIAQTPLTPMSKEVVAGSDQGANANPLFQFNYAPDPTKLFDNTTLDAWAHIYGLKFGREYDFLIFRMTNSGALPHELTDGKLPWNLQPPASFKLGQLKVTSASYNRRVPISHPRLPFAAAASNNGTLPAIPESVFPLARSLPKSSTVADVHGNALPLLLLWRASGAVDGNNAAYNFAVRAPQTNLQTWDRWVAAYPDPAPAPDPKKFSNTRAALYADFVTSAKKSVNEALPLGTQITLPTPADTSIDDPAVSYLRFELTVISTSADNVPIDQLDQIVPVPGPNPIGSTFTYRDGFAQVQSLPYAVKVFIGGAVGMKIDPAARTAAITIPEGDIWKLTISPIVTADAFARFETFTGTDNQFGDRVTVTDPATGQPISVYCAQAAARELLIEAAAPLVDTDAAVLWSSLKLNFDKIGRILTADLDPALMTRPDLFYRADVTHQVWRWMGRPFPVGQLPSGTPLDGNFPVTLGSSVDLNVHPSFEDALYWEAQAFAERSLTDTHTDSSNVNYTLLVSSTFDQKGKVTTIKAKPNPRHLTRYDLSKDPRAHYYLVSVALHGRYEGLTNFYTDPNGATTQRVKSNELFADGSTPWRRAFLPATAAATAPPKPKILLCLPLTEPLDPTTDNTTTGFLVIADEPWPQIAGLAEELRANIQYAPDPEVSLGSLDAGSALPEIGPDPILFSTAYSGPADPTFSSPGKPIGTTFDDLSSAPLFANTCFHFPVPDKLTACDWQMAKMTFTRSIRSDLTVNGKDASIVLQSAPSDPQWVQFLPSSYHFCYETIVGGKPQPPEAEALSVSDLTFEASGTGIQFLLGGNPITIVAGPAGLPARPAQLELWAMLMRQITDAAGKLGESYRGIYRPMSGGDGSFQPIDKAGLGNAPAGYVPEQDDYIYLLEVQKDTRNIDITHDPGGVPAALFAPTVPGNPEKEITHRIVRLSPRIANPTT